MRRSALLLLLLAPLTSCQCAAEPPSGPQPGWTWLVRYSTYDNLTEAHILNQLDAHAIERSYVCQLGVCDLAVPTDQYDTAVKLLRLELRDRNFLAILHTPHGKESFAIDESAWEISHPGLSYQDLLTRQEAAATTHMGAALREPSIVAAIAEHPYVVRIEALPRTYLGLNRTLQNGHDFVIGLAKSRDGEPEGRLGVQVGRGGQVVWERPSFSYALPAD